MSTSPIGRIPQRPSTFAIMAIVQGTTKGDKNATAYFHFDDHLLGFGLLAIGFLLSAVNLPGGNPRRTRLGRWSRDFASHPTRPNRGSTGTGSRTISARRHHPRSGGHGPHGDRRSADRQYLSEDVQHGSVKALTDQWWSMVEHAIREGGRLGVNIGMFNCPGWSQSGGPWIKPEQAMRTWSPPNAA